MSPANSGKWMQNEIYRIRFFLMRNCQDFVVQMNAHIGGERALRAAHVGLWMYSHFIFILFASEYFMDDILFDFFLSSSIFLYFLR